MNDEIAELRKQNKLLATALRQHHDWQCDAENLFMFYENPKTERLECCDIAGEYGDSNMYDMTARALNSQLEMERKYAKRKSRE